MLGLLFSPQSYTLTSAPRAPVAARAALSPQMAAGAADLRVGVLAIQGGFVEHMDALGRQSGVVATEVRTPEELAAVDAIILPGGESTAMAIMTEGDGLFPALREAVGNGVPAYGTCAGLILLADDCVGQKAGGQALVGGLDCTVCRNYFGAQVSSFELPLEGFPDAAPAVFIRAPAILKRGPTCEALASVTSAPSRDAAPHVEAFEPAMYLSAMSEFMIAPSTRRARVT